MEGDDKKVMLQSQPEDNITITTVIQHYICRVPNLCVAHLNSQLNTTLWVVELLSILLSIRKHEQSLNSL